jgi:hypothetical protein
MTANKNRPSPQRPGRRDFLKTSLAVAAGAATVGASVFGGAPSIASAAPDTASSRLAFTAAGPEYRFDTGVLQGTLRAGGKSLGLRPVVDVASGTRLSGGMGLFSPYRLLTPEARFGHAAWDWPSRARLPADGGVEVHWLPDKEHPLDLKAVYRFASPNALDFLATVAPQRDLRRFELFLASYFSGFAASFVYVQSVPQAGGKPGFLEATKRAGDWQMFPRDEDAVRMITDGRWLYPPDPPPWKIGPKLAAPLALRRDARSGLTALVMAPAGDCFAVSTPYGQDDHRSLYLSLLGRDLKAGHTASARARLVIAKTISDQQAVDLYRAYVR